MIRTSDLSPAMKLRCGLPAPEEKRIRAKRGTGSASQRKASIKERLPMVRALLDTNELPSGVEVKATSSMPNETEQEYLDMAMLQKHIGEIADVAFAPIRLRVGVGRCWYTPDIVMRHNDGNIEVVECKGWRWANGITKAKAAALIFPNWRFRIVKKTKEGWEYEELT